MTIHGSKGLEFDFVFLPRWNDGEIPSYRTLYDDNGQTKEQLKKKVEEERRVAYVGFTRARFNVWVSCSQGTNKYGKKSSSSRFIKDLGLKRDY